MYWGFPGSSDGKESAPNVGAPVQFLGREDPLEKGQATQSSIFAWRIPMGRGAWQAAVLGGHKELGMTDQLSTRSAF